MKKVVILLVLLSVCTFALATEGRVRGMGVNSIFYDDDYLFTIFPQYISHYMNKAYIDAHYYSDDDKTSGYQYSGGLNFELFGNDFGAYINRDFPIKFAYEHAALDKAMNLYLALGGLGLGFDVAMDYYKGDSYSSKSTFEENILGLGGKIGLEVGGFDVAGHVYFATGKAKEEGIGEMTDNAIVLYGVTRMKMFETDKSCIYPKAELEIGTKKEVMKYSTKADDKDEITLNYINVEPGIGLNHWLTDEVLVIAAVSCGFLSSKEKDTPDSTSYFEENWTIFNVPTLELGMEAYLTKWLTVRAGINKEYGYYSFKGEVSSKDEYKEKFYLSTFDYAFGIGLTFGKWTIDWEVCDDLFWNGPFIVTGNENSFASAFTIKYSFGK